MAPQVKPWRVAGRNKYVNCGTVAIVKKLSPFAASLFFRPNIKNHLKKF